MDDKTIILLCLSVIVFSIIFIFYVKRKRNKDDKWLVENKYARKVYLDSSIGIKSLVVQVQKVNGEKI